MLPATLEKEEDEKEENDKKHEEEDVQEEVQEESKKVEVQLIKGDATIKVLIKVEGEGRSNI